MARYDHLPIWNDAMKLSVGIERAMTQFPRDHKYALGAEMCRAGDAGRYYSRFISARLHFYPQPNPRKET